MSLAALIGAGPTVAAQDGDPIGSVIAIRGDVQAVTADGQSRELAMKQNVFRRDTIRTGAHSRVQMMFADNTVISLGRDTVMSLEEFEYDPKSSEGAMVTRVDEGVFRVLGGALTAIAPEKFRTETPTATIGIRGSFYAGSYIGNELQVVFLGGKGIFVINDQGFNQTLVHGIWRFLPEQFDIKKGD